MKTEYFPGNVKPVHIGVYERQAANAEWYSYSYWNGKHWCCSTPSPGVASKYSDRKSASQNRKWRGLTEQPK